MRREKKNLDWIEEEQIAIAFGSPFEDPKPMYVDFTYDDGIRPETAPSFASMNISCPEEENKPEEQEEC